MISDSVNEVESAIRQAEVMAVVRALRSGHTPRIGDTLDYFIEIPFSPERFGTSARPRNKPYRFAVEQWHLDAARMVTMADAVSGPAYR